MSTLAETRLWDAINRLRLPNLTTDIRFEVALGVGSAYWTQPDPTRPAKIVVDETLAEELPGQCLEALLLHEIMHHIGYDKNMLNPKGKNRFLVNLALDICLERALSSDPQLKADLQMLNDILLEDSLVQRNSPLHEALVFFVHSAPPFDRLPRGFKTRWTQIWGSKRLRFSAEDVYRLLASIPGTNNLKAPTDDSPFVQRYEQRPQLDWTENPSSCDSKPRWNQPTYAEPQPTESTRSPAESSNRSVSTTGKTPSDSAGDPQPPPRFTSVGQWSRFLRETIEGNRFSIKVNPKLLESPPSKIVNQIFREIKNFDARVVVRELVGSGDLKVTHSPFLSNPTTKAIADSLSGQPQMYYENWSRSTPTLSSVYFDVSGSMRQFLPQMVAFAATLRALRPARVFVFDTAVTPVTLEDVATGHVFTGGGTSFAAVLHHVMQHRPRQFFIVTDNADYITPSSFAPLKAHNIQSLALVFGHRKQPWDKSYHVNSY